MVEADTKPLPFTVRVKPVPPAVAFCGVMVEILGAGLPPPVDPEPPEFPEFAELTEFAEPPQFTNGIRTAAVMKGRNNRKVIKRAMEVR